MLRNIGIFISLILATNAVGQINEQLDQIISKIENNNIRDSYLIKSVDLDFDGDLDYIFGYTPGESAFFEIYINKNGLLTKEIEEFGRIQLEFENSVNYDKSKIVLKSSHNHCCGESPFDSYRKFSFLKDNVVVKENYLLYDYVNYNESKKTTVFEPKVYLEKPYNVKITFDNYNVRFSATIDDFKAYYTCEENTNIIAKVKKGSVVKVIGEFKGWDRNERTWLYVEIEENSLNYDTCESPFTYEFSNQVLRGWISDKSIISQ